MSQQRPKGRRVKVLTDAPAEHADDTHTVADVQNHA